jgi:hypothetical protein
VLVVRFDNDPRNNLTDRAIATAISKLEASGLPIPDRIHLLNTTTLSFRPSAPNGF